MAFFPYGWGALNGDTAGFTVKIYSTTSATSGTTNANDTAIPFYYRLGSAPGNDDWGDYAFVSTGSDGYDVLGSNQNKVLLVEVDPAYIKQLDSDAGYCYVDIDWFGDGGTDANYAIYIDGFFAPRYPREEQISTTP